MDQTFEPTHCTPTTYMNYPDTPAMPQRNIAVISPGHNIGIR
ncbi:MAG: hypothetical protein PVG09_03435 [Thiohalocapsa sp.]